MDVYLLGAGFSSDAGVPTMKNFIEGVRNTASDSSGADIHRVLSRAIAYAAQAGTDNIEDLLLAAVNEPVFFDLIWAFGLTINHYSRQFLDRCQNAGNIGWYEDFARIVAETQARVLTFNYDLILEEVLWWRVGCRESYQFPFNETRHRPENGQDVCAVPLYKLHGSVSWLWCLDCLYTINRYRHVISAAYERTPCPRCSARLIPLLVPPTYRKARHLVSALDVLWQQADTMVARADRLIIGGLSLADRDADVRQRFLSGMRKNSALREVVLVNRDKETCLAISRLLPDHVPWRAVSGFPQFCREQRLPQQNRESVQ